MTPVLTAHNGYLSAAELAVADTGPNGPQRLRRDFATSWARMIARGMPRGHLRSGYRDRAQQAAEVRRAQLGLTPSAARPGTSFHGEGLAADADEPARSWIRAHGAAHGILIDTVSREPWHFLYDASRDRYAGTPPPKPTPTPTPEPEPEPDPTDGEDEDEMTNMERVLEGTYRIEVGRTPAPEELDPRLLRIALGESTLAAEVESIDRSVESNRYAVRQVYLDQLGRAGSVPEWDHWITTTGNDLAKITAGVAAQPEAKARRA